MELMAKLKALWGDERGITAPIGLILVTTITALGAIVGLAHYRDQIVQKMGDVATALDNVDQSFSYTIQIDTDGVGGFDFTKSASYVDNAATLTDPTDEPPACIEFILPPFIEGPGLNTPSGEFP